MSVSCLFLLASLLLRPARVALPVGRVAYMYGKQGLQWTFSNPGIHKMLIMKRNTHRKMNKILQMQYKINVNYSIKKDEVKYT